MSIEFVLVCISADAVFPDYKERPLVVTWSIPVKQFPLFTYLLWDCHILSTTFDEECYTLKPDGSGLMFGVGLLLSKMVTRQTR
jgi:hypothetical protein